MIIESMARGLLCVTAHPDGCARRVLDEIEYVRRRPRVHGPRSALVIGASAGLGLAARVTAAFAAGSATVGVCHERPGTSTRCGSAGWYNTAALEAELARAGHLGRTVVGDAFSDTVKERTAELIGAQLGQVDLVVYSLAAPRRIDPETGERYQSVLKAVGTPYTDKSYSASTGQVVRATMPAATEEEIRQTVAVMGGDDWRRWIEALRASGVLAPQATTVAFSYVGNEWLAPTYRRGTIGRAKEHLEQTARELDAMLRPGGGRAHTAVMRALVTQASLVLPIQTLWLILLLRVTREMGLSESPIAQLYRLFADRLYAGEPTPVDEAGRIRLDDWELRADVQAEVRRRWELVTTENLSELGAPGEYRAEGMRLYGFGLPDVDYDLHTDPVREIPGIVMA